MNEITTIKEGKYYKSGSSIFKVLKVNNRNDGSVSINADCYYGFNKIYTEDLPIHLLRAFYLLESSKLFELLFNE